MEESERSFARIEQSDLERLSQLCKEDREEFFSRHSRWQQLYSDRIICVALCQCAALHYVNGKTGVKDFDVWTFYSVHPDAGFPCRRVGRRDYGPSKFGKNPDDPGCIGRRVDLIGRSIRFAVGGDPIQSIQTYLSDRHTKTAWALSQKAVVLVEPRSLIGKIVWPKESPV